MRAHTQSPIACDAPRRFSRWIPRSNGPRSRDRWRPLRRRGLAVMRTTTVAHRIRACSVDGNRPVFPSRVRHRFVRIDASEDAAPTREHLGVKGRVVTGRRVQSAPICPGSPSTRLCSNGACARIANDCVNCFRPCILSDETAAQAGRGRTSGDRRRPLSNRFFCLGKPLRPIPVASRDEAIALMVPT